MVLSDYLKHSSIGCIWIISYIRAMHHRHCFLYEVAVIWILISSECNILEYHNAFVVLPSYNKTQKYIW